MITRFGGEWRRVWLHSMASCGYLLKDIQRLGSSSLSLYRSGLFTCCGSICCWPAFTRASLDQWSAFIDVSESHTNKWACTSRIMLNWFLCCLFVCSQNAVTEKVSLRAAQWIRFFTLYSWTERQTPSLGAQATWWLQSCTFMQVINSQVKHMHWEEQHWFAPEGAYMI